MTQTKFHSFMSFSRLWKYTSKIAVVETAPVCKIPSIVLHWFLTKPLNFHEEMKVPVLIPRQVLSQTYVCSIAPLYLKKIRQTTTVLRICSWIDGVFLWCLQLAEGVGLWIVSIFPALNLLLWKTFLFPMSCSFWIIISITK